MIGGWLATRFGADASMAFNLASTLTMRGALNVAALATAMASMTLNRSDNK